MTIDKQGRIQSYNRAAETIFGHTAKEVIGRNVKMLMPLPYATEHDGYLSRYQREGTPHVIGIGRKVHGLRKNGEVFPMRLAVTEVRRGNEPIFIGLEWLTQPIHEPRTDDGSGQVQQRLVNIKSPLESDT